MKEHKYCHCSGFARKLKRLYVRRGYVNSSYVYKRKFVAVGWICEYCSEIIKDDGKKYIPFDKYHILEFDYKQLQRNFDKFSVEGTIFDEE